MEDPGREARERLIRWMLDLIGRPPDFWDRAQRAFLDSLLRGHEGTKTLAELAVTTVRIKTSGLRPEALGRLKTVHAAIEDFWNNPSLETYEKLRTAGRSLTTDA